MKTLLRTASLIAGFRCICLLFSLLYATGIYAGIKKDHFALHQQTLLKGKVVNEKDEPLQGATVSVKEHTKSTLTNENGEFELDANAGDVLVISYVGYIEQNFKVKAEETSIIIRLLPISTNKLDEVVIVGYQKQSAKKTTSSMQVVSGRDIENLPAPSFDQLLQGKVSGVNIQNFSGEPGVRNTFTIRGNSTITTDFNSGIDEARTMSTPLYVIDGIPMNVTDLDGVSSTGTNILAGIPLSDIESITVQKDAAATAVWGSRGANGVIIIQTKKGRTKTPQLRAAYYKGLIEKPKLLPTTIGAEERRQKMDLFNQYGSYAQLGNIPQILTDSLNPSFNNATDWQDIFYQRGNLDNIDLSLSSNAENINYRISGNYYDESGIVRQTGFKRYALRGNFGFIVNPKLNINLNMALSRLDRKRGIGRGRNEILPINVGQMPASFYALTQEDKDFYYGAFDKIKDKNITDVITLSTQINYKILKGLDYSFQGSYSNTSDKRDRFQPSVLDANGVSFAESATGSFQSYYLANILSYNKVFNDTHTLSLVGTQTFQLDQREGNKVGGYNVPDDNIKVVSGIPQQDLYGSSYFQKAGLLSYVGQLSYDYLSRYLFNISMRADASSRFGANTKWGYFPAVSLGYIVSDEPFMKDISWLTLLKLRGSYGLSGTMPDDFYAPFNV
ncbi:MAG TPA: SusC/RagA family TonB-linked outer membrane protein [Niabella sp.]|mgnify:CR=1 FL=1|nr:SusC/RagA family TonB-linked outer membrane protein [Niabella sp.]